MFFSYFLVAISCFTLGGYLAIMVFIHREELLTKQQEAVISGFADMVKWLGIISLIVLVLISGLPDIIIGVATAALTLSLVGMFYSIREFLEAYHVKVKPKEKSLKNVKL